MNKKTAARTWSRRGRPIRSLDALAKHADRGGTVSVLGWQNACPAAFVMAMQARLVKGLIDRGMHAYMVPGRLRGGTARPRKKV